MHAWALAWLDVGLGGLAAAALGARSPGRGLWLSLAGACGSAATRQLAFGTHAPSAAWNGVLGAAVVSLTGAVALAALAGLLALWLQPEPPADERWPQAAPGRRR